MRDDITYPHGLMVEEREHEIARVIRPKLRLVAMEKEEAA